ncbi:MAG TPA: c-type cytochrome [Steroidobacteraceae bacterium]|jgi:cytochrome c553|nr:c-type cytochrome [Steroidobacteraceae bacterium]
MRNITLASRTLRTVSSLAVAAVLATAVFGARADEPDAAAKAYVHKVAVGTCGTCHGPDGNSTQPKFPRLAGQRASYLVTQLKGFRAQTRGDPDAIGYMWGMAAELDDATIEALAAYYSAQKPAVSRSGDAPLVSRGREIYEHGVPAQGVPACGTCHGADARGQQDFPRLAGQHAQYVLKQLASFQSSMRNVAIMHGVAQNLRLPEMQAVAAYLEAQP